MPFLPARSLPSTAAALVVLAGALIVGLGEFRDLQLQRSLTATAPGTLTRDAQCHTAQWRGREQFSLSVAYVYTVDGVTHAGDAYFVHAARVSQALCESVAASLKAGRSVSVFVDARDPRFAVLDPSRNVRLLLVAVPLALAAIAYLAHGLLRARRGVPRGGRQGVA